MPLKNLGIKDSNIGIKNGKMGVDNSNINVENKSVKDIEVLSSCFCIDSIKKKQ